MVRYSSVFSGPISEDDVQVVNNVKSWLTESANKTIRNRVSQHGGNRNYKGVVLNVGFYDNERGELVHPDNERMDSVTHIVIYQIEGYEELSILSKIKMEVGWLKA